MKSSKLGILLSISLILCVSMTACRKAPDTITAESSDMSSYLMTTEVEVLEMTDDDPDSSYGEDIDTIYLDSASEDITIDEGGSYLITGTASDLMILVDASEDEEVHLILRDATINNSDAAVIFVLSADKVKITLEGDSILTGGENVGSYEGIDIDGVIRSETDLTINGNGSLTITSPAAHGIVCKDDMVIAGGSYEIGSSDDGIHVDGSLLIADGDISIVTEDDGIHADGILQIDSAEADITAAEGLEATNVIINDGNITISASDDGINAAQKDDEHSPAVIINGGNITIDMAQGDTDGIDSNGDIIINGGTIIINGPSPCDYDISASLNGGTLIINGEETDTIPSQFTGGTVPEGQGGAPGGGMIPPDQGRPH